MNGGRMLSSHQFDILYRLMRKEAFTQRELARVCGLSLGSVNKACRSLCDAGLIDDAGITAEGLASLAPYKVRTATVLAAGAATRLAPLSFEKPKAMFEVRGDVLIERLIAQLREAGIERIAVVVGHMKESFFYLREKCGVEIVVNPDYAVRGSHASLYAARDIVCEGGYVCSSDQYYSENPFASHEYGPRLYLDRKAARTNDMAVSWSAKGFVTSVKRDRGDEWCMRGPVCLDASAAHTLVEAIAADYDAPGMQGAYWDEVYAAHFESFAFRVALLPEGMLHEFDFMSDLCAFDGDFLANVDSKILDNICATLHCAREDIVRVRPVKAGLTNLSVLFSCRGEQYVYRHPGAGTDEIVNRQAEACALAAARRLGLDGTYVFEDPEEGWKISRYVAGCVDFDYRDCDHVSRALAMIRRLHESGERSPWSFDFYDEACRIEGLLRDSGYPLPRDFSALSDTIGRLAGYVRAEAGEPVLCHNDFYGPNVLVKGDEMHLIDWEYSAMGDYACDIGNFIAQGSGYTVDQAAHVVDVYFGGTAREEDLLHCLGCTAIVGYYWYVWAIYKESQGNAMSEWLYTWYRAAKEFCAWALPRYEEREVLMRPLSEKEFDELVAKEQEGAATPEDIKRLEPYRARRAVFFAAGFGSRMLPITVNTPKPLVRVHGARIIDRLIDAVLAVGIEEIYVVRGYLKEEFDQLLAKYPMIRFIDNDRYDVTNNISSAVAAKGLFENAYVFESDLYLANPALVTKYHYRSNYLGMPVDSTDDWYFDVDETGRIVKLAKGKDAPCYQLAGLSYWTAEDGARLSGDIVRAFEENDENKQIFWDDVALRLYADRYDVRFREYERDDIVEIDSFAELQAVDPAYRVS